MEAIAIYKLLILYLLDRAGGELNMPRISSFLLENGYTNFETLLQTYNEIEKNGFVEELRRDGMTILSITKDGEETLGFFADQIPDGMKLQVRQYLKEAGREIVNKESIVGEYYRSTFGGYTVRLVIKERRRSASVPPEPLLTVELAVPDEESARRSIQRWKEHSGEIYRDLLKTLL